jgi:pimeloyl-ACP methyl ester carboxylesterase/DNA-binding CsgD family transcriptional regulator
MGRVGVLRDGDRLLLTQGEQRVRFCRSRDGVRLAYAVHGQGPVLVRAGSWLTHLEHDWESAVWRRWLEELGRTSTVVRYDERGCGLSERNLDGRELSLDIWVADMAAVVQAAGVEQFDLWGISQGAALAVEYAARYPEQVRRLVLFGGYARGRRRRSQAEREQADVVAALVEAGWGSSNSDFRRHFAQLLFPQASAAELEPFEELQRRSASPAAAARIHRARHAIDVTASASRVRAETLVMHARDDALVPMSRGTELASLIPGAEFVPLDGRNHLMRADDEAWPMLVARINEFLRRPAHPPPLRLTARESEVVKLVAQGFDNEAIAGALVLSVRTVERHLSNVYAKLGVSGPAARAATAAAFARLL